MNKFFGVLLFVFSFLFIGVVTARFILFMRIGFVGYDNFFNTDFIILVLGGLSLWGGLKLWRRKV